MTDDNEEGAPRPNDKHPHAGRRDHGPSALLLLGVAVVLVVGGYFLAVKLKSMVQLQNCVMSGRTNCAPIVPPPQ